MAGATLLAAGCNSPELIASSISLFIAHSTVGAGTIVGSAPFNILGITGASVLAVGGLTLPASMMVRESFFLFAVLAAFTYVMADQRIYWQEALFLASIYFVYVAACIFWSKIVGCCSKTSTDPDGGKKYAPLVDEAPKDSTPKSMSGMLLKQSRFYAYAPVGRAGGYAWRSKYVSLDATSESRPLVVAPLGHDGTPAEHLYRSINLAAAYEIELVVGGAAAALGYTVPNELHIHTRTKVGGRRMVDKEWPDDIKPIYNLRHSIGGGAAMRGAAGADPSMTRLEGLDAKAITKLNPVEKPLRLRRMISYSGPHNAPSKNIEQEHVFRLMPGEDPRLLHRWYEALSAKSAELRKKRPKAAIGIGAADEPEEEGDEDIDEAEGEHDEHNVWAVPPTFFGVIMWLLTLPLIAPIHLTVPDVRKHENKYLLTCLMSLVWLIILATLMTHALESIGWIIHFGATVMGLTLRAMGTSFPNLYASVLAAQAARARWPSCRPSRPTSSTFASPSASCGSSSRRAASASWHAGRHAGVSLVRWLLHAGRRRALVPASARSTRRARRERLAVGHGPRHRRRRRAHPRYAHALPRQDPVVLRLHSTARVRGVLHLRC